MATYAIQTSEVACAVLHNEGSVLGEGHDSDGLDCAELESHLQCG